MEIKWVTIKRVQHAFSESKGSKSLCGKTCAKIKGFNIPFFGLGGEEYTPEGIWRCTSCQNLCGVFKEKEAKK